MSEDTKQEPKTGKGSLLDKLKKQPKWVWFAAALGGGALILLYERMHTSSSTSGTLQTGYPSLDNGLNTGSLDNLPLGYDSGYPGSSTTVVSGTPTPTPTPPTPTPGPLPTPNPTPNPIPNPTPNPNSPIIPFNYFPNGQFPTQYQNGQVPFNYNGTLYKVVPGSNGLVWGDVLTPLDRGGYSIGQQVLLYGPASRYSAMGNGSGGSTGFNEGWNTATGHNDASLFAHWITNGGLEA